MIILLKYFQMSQENYSIILLFCAIMILIIVLIMQGHKLLDSYDYIGANDVKMNECGLEMNEDH